MPETPTSPDHEAVKTELAENILSNEQFSENAELDDDIRNREAIAGNLTHLRRFLVASEGEDPAEVAAEQTALREAVAEVAENHEGVSETLIMLWINGGEISDQMVDLHERGVRTYADLLEDEDAVSTIQRIGVELGLDLGDTGEEGDGVDGNYGAKTRAAWAQVQEALVEAGYDLGEFGENNDGVDGAVGEVTMNILMNAAQSVAPDEVVEDAIAEAADPDREGAAAERETQFDAIRGEAEDGAEISADHLNEYAANLARGFEGVQYDEENQVFTHILTDETLPASEVISGTYGDIDRGAMNTAVGEYNTAQINAFADEQGVEVVDHEGSPHFEHEGRMMSVNDILSDQMPLDRFERWQSGQIEGVEAIVDEDYEETEIPAAQLRNLTDRVLRTDGVRGVEASGDGYTVRLFDGSEVSLDSIYANVGEDGHNPLMRLETLENSITTAANRIAEDHGLDFSPENRTGLSFQPAQFMVGDEFAFRLSEIDAGDLDENIGSNLRHDGAEAVFAEIINGISGSD